MRKRGTNNQKVISPLVYFMFSLVVLVAAIFVVFAQHTAEYDEDLDSVVQNTVILQVQQYSERIHAILYSLSEDRQHISYLIENANTVDDKEMAAAAAASGKIHKAIVCDAYGHGVDQTGDAVDISDEEYFRNMAETRNFSGTFAIKDPKSSKEDEIVTAQQISASSGTRYLLIYYLSENMRTYLRNITCGENTSFSLIDHDGSVIVSEGNKTIDTGDNFWSETEKNTEKHKTYLIKKHVLRNVAGCDEYSTTDGEARILVYSPLNAENMYLVAEIDPSYITLQTRGLRSDTESLKGSIMAVVIVFAIVMMIISSLTLINTDKTSVRLQEKADTDLLTSLNNKLATERKIKEYMSDNPTEQCAMLLLDIDNFKKINDTLGHAFGDEVLRTLGNHIGSVFRVTDVIGRTGGDEFMIFLKGLKTDDIICGEALKAAMFFENFQAGGYVKYSATASIGIAVYPREGENFEDLYKSADIALYKAKNRGKNQIAFHDEKLGEKYKSFSNTRKPDDPRA